MKFKQVLAASVSSLALVMGLSGGIVGATSGMGMGENNNHHNNHRDCNQYHKNHKHHDKCNHKDHPNHDKNKCCPNVSERVEVKNDNRITLDNSNEQYAHSGDAEVEHNTTGGDARTGDASNSNTFNANVSVKNSGVGMSGVNNDHGNVTRNVKITNTNDIEINNVNNQKAISGDAEVSHNTTGGSAITGNATNTNSTSLTVNVSN